MATLDEQTGPRHLPPRPPWWSALMRPGVALRETHISWVFLDDERAIKVKKPVDLGFLDFTTLEKRYAACRAEVELNRRLAPSVYRGVAPLLSPSSQGGGYRLGPAFALPESVPPDVGGQVVDWAVVMERLPDRERGDRLLAEGRLDRDALAVIARRLAAFHAECRSDQAAAAFGTADAIGTNVLENFAQASHLTRFLTAEEALEVKERQLRFVAQHRELFESRMRAGRVRDGHGDLRLEHIYLRGAWRGAAGETGGEAAEVRVLDCIEFNDRFRYADTCADVAFLAMDLAKHHRVDLAEQLLGLYARESGDYDLYAVVDFYLAYRAIVRGKVASFALDVPGTPADVVDLARHEARSTFVLALASGRVSPIPNVMVVVGGIIASGKSSLADALSVRMGAPVVSTDRTRKQLAGVRPTAKLSSAAWSGAYDVEVSKQVYDESLRRAAQVLASGRSVIVDGSFRSRTARDEARAVGLAQGVPVWVVECRAPPSVCRERVARRDPSTSVSDGDLRVFDAFLSRYEPLTAAELAGGHALRVDATLPTSDLADEVVRHLAVWPAHLTG